MITAFPFASRESKTYLRRNAASPLEEAEIDAALVALGFNTLACGFAELAVPSLAPVTYDADKKRLKVAQMEAVLPFMRGEHTVDRRTMGAGKTLVMAIVLKILKARQPSGFLWLLDPTRDLTKDHAQRFRDFGFNVVAYDPEAPNAEEQRKMIMAGACDLMITSPEAATSTFRGLTRTKIFKENLLGVLVDEAHLVTLWGSFRAYGFVGELISEKCPVLLASGSATAQNLSAILDVLGVLNPVIVSRPMFRSDLFLAVRKRPSRTGAFKYSYLKPLMEMLTPGPVDPRVPALSASELGRKFSLLLWNKSDFRRKDAKGTAASATKKGAGGSTGEKAQASTVMMEYCQNTTTCRWEVLLKPFHDAPPPGRVRHSCCDICYLACACNLCVDGHHPSIPWYIAPYDPAIEKKEVLQPPLQFVIDEFERVLRSGSGCSGVRARPAPGGPLMGRLTVLLTGRSPLPPPRWTLINQGQGALMQEFEVSELVRRFTRGEDLDKVSLWNEARQRPLVRAAVQAAHQAEMSDDVAEDEQSDLADAIAMSLRVSSRIDDDDIGSQSSSTPPLLAASGAACTKRIPRVLMLANSIHKCNGVFENIRRDLSLQAAAYSKADSIKHTDARIARWHSCTVEEVRHHIRNTFVAGHGEIVCTVATAVAEHGIDFEHLDIVVSIGAPPTLEQYFQGIGRMRQR